MGERELFVGIDVSLDTLEIAYRPGGEGFRVNHDPRGLAELVERLREREPSLIALEASGGLEILPVAVLAEAELPVIVVNAGRVREFAKAIGRLAKTDRIDAEVIARYGEATRPEIRPLPDDATKGMRALVTRRGQLADDLAAERTRRNQTSSLLMRESIDAHIAWLVKAIDDIDRQIKREVKASPLWREKDELMRSVPGVGPVLSAIIMGRLPELGTLTNEQIAALVGVAPFNNDTGRTQGKRAIWGGRAKVRKVLYMATLSAIVHNPVIAEFYHRLLARGKLAKVALTACMHKLLTILNAMMRQGTKWRCPEGIVSTPIVKVKPPRKGRETEAGRAGEATCAPATPATAGVV